MTSIQVSLPCTWSLGVREHLSRGSFCSVPCFRYSALDFHSKESVYFLVRGCNRSARKRPPIFSSAVDDGMDPDNSGDESDEDESSSSEGETSDVS